MTKAAIESIYALSPMQQGMLFHSLYDQQAGVYFQQLSLELHGPFDAGAFERAWQQAVERHTILRMAFVWERLDRPMQVVQKSVRLPIDRQDWRELTDGEQEARLAAALDADRQ